MGALTRRLRRVRPFGWLLVSATVAVAVAFVFVTNTGLEIAAVVICLAWIAVYVRADPLARRNRGDDPVKDSIDWRDREL